MKFRPGMKALCAGAGLLFGGVLLVSGAVASDSGSASIGSAQSQGRVTIESGTSGDQVRMGASGHTIASGDVLRTHGNGQTVVTINHGGSVGVDQNSEVLFSLSESGAPVFRVQSGRILYSFPAARSDFRIEVGDFVLVTGSETGQVMVSNDDDGYSGMVERLKDGNLKVSVQHGNLRVENGSNRYQVNAGEQIGLLAGPFENVSTQMGLDDGLGAILEIESPEQVRTSEDFVVRWFGEVDDGDYLAIAPAGAEPEEFVTITETADGEVLQFTAPSETGEYEIRHISGSTGQVSSFVFLEVVSDAPLAAAWWARDGFFTGLALGAAVVGGAAIMICDCDDDPPPPPPVSP